LERYLAYGYYDSTAGYDNIWFGTTITASARPTSSGGGTETAILQ